MKIINVIWLAILLATNAMASSKETIEISGFGSIVGGVVVDGDGYWARMPEGAGKYDQGFEIQSETRIGIQGNLHLDSVEVVAQVVARGELDFDPSIEILTANYDIMPDWKVTAGRYRLPVYHFSDYLDVGYAYTWLRIPSDAYSLSLTKLEGISTTYNFDWGLGDTSFQLYYGQRDESPNLLLNNIEQYKGTQFLDGSGEIDVAKLRTSKEFKNMVGLVADTQIDWLGVRLSYLKGREKFTLWNEGAAEDSPAFPPSWTDSEFFDVSLTAEFGNLFMIAEVNRYTDIYDSYMTSITYTMDRITPYIAYSAFESEFTFMGDFDRVDDKYSTLSIGARYDLSTTSAIKFEVTRFDDKGEAPVYIDEDLDGETDSTSIHISYDFIF